MARRRKKSANGAGSIEFLGEGADRRAVLRITAPGLPRRRVVIRDVASMTDAQVRAEAKRLAADYRSVRLVFDDDAKRPASTPGTIVTIADLATAWTSGKLYETYGAVNRLRKIASGYINGKTIAKHILAVRTRGPSGPTFGELRVVEVTQKDVLAVMSAQPKDQRAQTRLHTYQRMRRMFDLAISPCSSGARATTP